MQAICVQLFNWLDGLIFQLCFLFNTHDNEYTVLFDLSLPFYI